MAGVLNKMPHCYSTDRSTANPTLLKSEPASRLCFLFVLVFPSSLSSPSSIPLTLIARAISSICLPSCSLCSSAATLAQQFIRTFCSRQSIKCRLNVIPNGLLGADIYRPVRASTAAPGSNAIRFCHNQRLNRRNHLPVLGGGSWRRLWCRVGLPAAFTSA
jgi:hypothetical protein